MKTKTTLALLALAMATGCAATAEDSVDSIQAALDSENAFLADTAGDDVNQDFLTQDQQEQIDAEIDELGDLENMDVELVDAGDVAVEPIDDVPPEDVCNHGGLIGRYLSLRPGMGVARGRVFNANRELIGRARFIWGTRRDGTRVIFGKYVDLDRRPVALFRGTAEDGHFRGHWIASNGNIGVARGRYGDPDPSTRGGVFAGRWARTNCEEPPQGCDPVPEVCGNAIDDDCDGEADEGCGAADADNL